MQYDDFIGEIQHRAQLDSRESALSATRATLTTLSERIDPGQAENLAAHLPEELGRHLETVDDVERFDFETFVERVADREEIGEDDEAAAAFHAQAVVDLVSEAVEGSTIEDVRNQLPADEGYDHLFAIEEQEESPV